MSNNILLLPRPTKDSFANCGNGCGNLSPTDPLDVNLLGPRRNREKVREQIKDYVKLMLGAPVLPLELDEQNLDGAVDFSLQIIEQYAPRDYFQWYSFFTTPGQCVYELPPEVGMVRQVVYKNIPQSTFSAADIGGVVPLEYMGSGSYGSIAGGINPQMPVWGKGSDWVVFKQYELMFTKMSSQIGGWEYIGGNRHIRLYPTPFKAHPVGVHYLQRKTDFREVTQSMQEGALAFAKIMVGRIRSRIKNPPGQIQNDGTDILQEGLSEKKEWEEKLITKWGDLLGPTYG